MTLFRQTGLALALALAATPALAQGTQAQREACTPDAFRLCASHIPNVAAITGCLRREEARLSPACRSAVQQATAPKVARQQPPARMAPASRVAVAPRAAVRRAVAEVPAPRTRARLAARPVAIRPVAARSVGWRQAQRHRRLHQAGLDGSRGGSGMRQARYWLNRLGGFAGLAGMGGAMDGFDGASLAGLRAMRVGDIMDVMEAMQ